MIKLIAFFLLLFTVSDSRTFAYEVTTPYGNSVNAWAVCEPGNAPGGLYVWTRNGILIPSVNSNWYFLQDADNGQLLRCGDSLDNLSPALQIGSAPTPSAPAPLPTPVPVPAPPPTQPPIDSTSGIVIRSPWGHSVGSWLICEVDSSRHVPQTFTWLRDGSIIAGSTNIGHFITADDEDTDLTCSITTTLSGDVVSDPLFFGTIFEPPASPPTPSPVVTPTITTPAPVVTPAPQPPSSTPAPIVVPPNNGKLDILDFSPHLAGDTPYSVLPDETVRQRVDLVAPYTNGCVLCLYDACVSFIDLKTCI